MNKLFLLSTAIHTSQNQARSIGVLPSTRPTLRDKLIMRRKQSGLVVLVCQKKHKTRPFHRCVLEPKAVCYAPGTQVHRLNEVPLMVPSRGKTGGKEERSFVRGRNQFRGYDSCSESRMDSGGAQAEVCEAVEFLANVLENSESSTGQQAQMGFFHLSTLCSRF